MMRNSPNNPVKEKVIIIGNGEGFGGAQTAFRLLCQEVNRTGRLALVISIGKYPGEKCNVDCRTFEIPFRSSTLGGKIRKFLALLYSRMLISKIGPGILISVGLNNTATYLFKFSGKSVFCCAQDFIHDRLMNDPLLERMVQASNGFVTQTKTMADRFKSLGFPGDYISYLPCFAEAPADDFLRAPYNPASRTKLCYFGRIAENKGIDLFISSMRSLGLNENFTLDIWGSGEIRDLLRIVEESGLSGRVNFMGSYPSGKEGAHLMCDYDGLILTSTKCEGLPLILIESMAYGLPLLVTDIGSMREVAMQNPDVVIASANVESLTTALEEYLGKIRNAEFVAERQKQYYIDNFSNVKFSQEWRAFLSDPQLFFQKASQ